MIIVPVISLLSYGSIDSFQVINEKKYPISLINIEKELDELVSFEKNRQLNQFSLLLFKKLKQNTLIDEK